MVDYEKIRKMVECELDKIAALPELNDTTLMQVDKLVDIAKDINELESQGMSFGGNSQRSYGGSYNGQNSYRSGRESYGSYNNGRSYNQGYNQGYSMHGSRDALMESLNVAMDNAQNDHERNAIRELMNKI